jgi:hypothetical protein
MHRRLEEQPEVTLDGDHRPGVLERLGAAAVDQAAHEPVEPVCAAEQHDLPQQVDPPVGQYASHHRAADIKALGGARQGG